MIPVIDVVIALFVVLVAILVVQIMILRVLKSFQQPPAEPEYDKKQMQNLTFKDMR